MVLQCPKFYFSSQEIKDIITKCTGLMRLSISHPVHSAKRSSVVASETSCTLNEHAVGTIRKVINNDTHFHAVTVLLTPTSHSKIYINYFSSTIPRKKKREM